MELSIECLDINNVDEMFYAYIVQHKKKTIVTLLNVTLN